MKLKNTRTEAEFRKELALSKKYLYESEKGQHALNAVRRICGEVASAYVLVHTPEQGEDVFRILVNGERIIGFDLQDQLGLHQATNITDLHVKAYESLLSGIPARLKLAVALELSKAGVDGT
jgi:hypothetical protein